MVQQPAAGRSAGLDHGPPVPDKMKQHCTGRSGVQQYHGEQRGERHEGDHEDQNEVPHVAGPLERLKHAVTVVLRRPQRWLRHGVSVVHKLIVRMLITSVLSLAAYGAVLGASSGWLQGLVSTAKLPMLFLVTLAICLPTLYLFNLLFGAKLSVCRPGR